MAIVTLAITPIISPRLSVLLSSINIYITCNTAESTGSSILTAGSADGSGLTAGSDGGSGLTVGTGNGGASGLTSSIVTGGFIARSSGTCKQKLHRVPYKVFVFLYIVIMEKCC